MTRVRRGKVVEDLRFRYLISRKQGVRGTLRESEA